MLILVFLAPIRYIHGQTNDMSDPIATQLPFVKRLYKQQAFYRSISEIYRLRYHFPEASRQSELDLYLLKNYFRLGDFQSAYKAGSEILESTGSIQNSNYTSKFYLITTASALHIDKEEEAKLFWNRFQQSENHTVFPSSNSMEGLVDPDRASFISGILPGSGLLMTGEYGKAATSFALNLVFIAGCYTAVMQEQYGIAGVLLFFEISWYFGGRKASAEAAESHNLRLIRNRQNTWINQQLKSNNLSDLIWKQ